MRDHEHRHVLIYNAVFGIDVIFVCGVDSFGVFFRSLCLGSVAEKRGRAIHISDLEELLIGCTQLEVRLHYKSN